MMCRMAVSIRLMERMSGRRLGRLSLQRRRKWFGPPRAMAEYFASLTAWSGCGGSAVTVVWVRGACPIGVSLGVCVGPTLSRLLMVGYPVASARETFSPVWLFDCMGKVVRFLGFAES
jgi:hypothetical protein